MKIKIIYLSLFLICFVNQKAISQVEVKDKIEQLKKLKTEITIQEKEALKIEVENINKRLENKSISAEDAQKLKAEAATKRALNIENRLEIVENQINLLERNNGDVLFLEPVDSTDNNGFALSLDLRRGDGSSIKWNKKQKFKKEIVYDRRTYSDFMLAVGLSNSIIDGQNLEDSPYKIGGSRFFEIGWQWRTRVFRNTNFLRLNYGFAFQFNGLKPKDNNYFVSNNGQTELEEFNIKLNKSKLRVDNLVFPVHLEFGPSKRIEKDDNFRYYLDRKFRFGIGGYGGFNIRTVQKLKYEIDGDNVKEKLTGSYNTPSFVYGLSAYTGFGGTLLYVKYEMSPLFKNAIVEQHNVALGLKFDL